MLFRGFVVFSILTLAACNGDTPAAAQEAVVDLSHTYSADTIYWPTADGFELEIESAGYTEAGYYYAANKFTSAEHGGTHLDAPIHFAADRWTVEQIPVDRLVGPAIKVDVRVKSEQDRDYQVQVSDLEAWEAAHGQIPTGVIVLLETGFSQHWPDRKRYLGTAELGPDAVPKLSFPGLQPDAARWLVTERDIHAIGLDTASIDYGRSTLFESHQILFDANIPAFENLTNLGELPEIGFEVVALPMKIGGGSGAPLRAIAVVPGAGR